MSEFAWFKLLIRAVGVLLLGLAAPRLLQVLATVFFDVLGSTPTAQRGTWDPLLRNLPALIGYGLQTGIGFYLLAEGRMLIELCLRGISGRCTACGYDLATVAGTKCPECGNPFRHPTSAPPPPSP